ncbi:Uncharacterised protein [Serratia grimesii]|nr:Uncharacterised protein [Serratia grimesii]CAI2524195.1 Uncharacterised protein [Serratia grimesii]CAI2786840.1 Uncharacterised protein [Serratia grimesii]CUW23744.1 Uncharacterised protein [Serratia grimesii]SMZ58322.1 Uncharacterised protein [Serratia grimesii]
MVLGRDNQHHRYSDRNIVNVIHSPYKAMSDHNVIDKMLAKISMADTQKLISGKK